MLVRLLHILIALKNYPANIPPLLTFTIFHPLFQSEMLCMRKKDLTSEPVGRADDCMVLFADMRVDFAR